jgi:4-hydroxybenzoate polyprenyltransferase
MRSLLRIHQYIKNLFIFAPAFFAFNFDLYIWLQLFIAFILFSLLASSIYIFNDLLDVEEDKKHPTKKFRAIASSKVSKKQAIIIMLILSLGSLATSYMINKNIFLVLFIYFLLNIAYSIKLKHISIVDIIIISIGFVLRLFVGMMATNIELSIWIIIMTFLLALFLAVAKRRDDVLISRKNNTEVRKNIDGYNIELVNSVMVLLGGVIIVAYILYTTSIDVMNNFNTQNLYITAVFVIIGIFRYMQITMVENNSGSPTKIALKDRFLQIVIILWIISFYLIVNIL